MHISGLSTSVHNLHLDAGQNPPRALLLADTLRSRSYQKTFGTVAASDYAFLPTFPGSENGASCRGSGRCLRLSKSKSFKIEISGATSDSNRRPADYEPHLLTHFYWPPIFLDSIGISG
jgi:hypothetical protein